MEALRLIQVSDIHLSRKRAYFQDNWEAFLEAVRAEPPRFVVVTGDLCVDGPGEPDDIAFAREQLDRLPVPWAAIPGNHDLGDRPPDAKLGQNITDALRERYLAHFGEDWWLREVGGWRLIGLDSQLFASGLAAEGEQARWLERTLAEGDGAPVALFLHKPLWVHDPADATLNSHDTDLPNRTWLLKLCLAHNVRFVGAGHVHRFWQFTHAGIEFLWCPATAFRNSGKLKVQEERRILGYAELHLADERVTSRVVIPSTFTQHDMSEAIRTLGSTAKLPPRPYSG